MFIYIYIYIHVYIYTDADLEGVQGVRTPPPLFIPNMYETTVYPCSDKTINYLGCA